MKYFNIHIYLVGCDLDVVQFNMGNEDFFDVNIEWEGDDDLNIHEHALVIIYL
jgi:hypothetical protein